MKKRKKRKKNRLRQLDFFRLSAYNFSWALKNFFADTSVSPLILGRRFYFVLAVFIKSTLLPAVSARKVTVAAVY
jgi:hypothetical protein